MAAFVAYSLDVASRRLCLRSPTPLIEGAPVVWAHVAHEGEWRGHPNGPFKLTRAHFTQAVANLSARDTPPKVDFDHETDFQPPGTPLPARGWVQDLQIRPGPNGRAQLWAQVELGAKAVEAQRDGGYRFCSAVFDFEAKDRVSGEPIGFCLQRLALTDDPFIDGQSPIRIALSAVEAPMGGPPPAGASEDRVMVAWYPPAELAGDLALEGGEPAERLHVTIAFFGLAKDLVPESIERIAAILDGFAPSVEPMLGTVGGLGRFAASETSDGLDVVYAPVDVPGLSQLRGQFITALWTAGGPAPREAHDFSPHMTLMSIAPDAAAPIQRVMPRSIRVATLELVVGDTRRPFELGKPPTTEEATMADENKNETEKTGAGEGAGEERKLSAADNAIAALASKLSMTPEELLAAMESKSDAIVAALGSQPAASDVTLSALRVQLSAATARSTKAEQEAAATREQLKAYREKEADAAVEELIKGGRILDSGRAFARGLFLSDRQGFDAFTGGLPKAVPVGPHASGGTPPTEKTPAIDENDPEVKELRVWLSNAGITGAAADKAVLKRLSERSPGTAI